MPTTPDPTIPADRVIAELLAAVQWLAGAAATTGVTIPPSIDVAVEHGIVHLGDPR